MQDLVTLGTGNSRFMKSAIGSTTTWEQFRDMLRAGTFPFDFNGVNPSGIAQQGTALNKANLLPDSVAALYGFGSDAVPSNVLQVLARFQSGLGNEYLWEKSKIEAVPTYTETVNTGQGPEDLPVTIYYSDSFTISGSASPSYSFVLNSPASFYFTESNFEANKSKLLGKYIAYTSGNQTKLIFIPEDANLTNTLEFVTADKATVLTDPSLEDQAVVYGYVNSPDPSAYPPSVSDGYTYTPLGQLGNKVRIATGSYTGTGTYGSSNPNSLTFEFEPKIVIVSLSGGIFSPSDGWNGGFIWVYGINGTNMVGRYTTFFAQNGNTLSWYSRQNADYQLNNQNVTYNYLAWG